MSFLWWKSGAFPRCSSIFKNAPSSCARSLIPSQPLSSPLRRSHHLRLFRGACAGISTRTISTTRVSYSSSTSSAKQRKVSERRNRNRFLLKVHPDLFASHPAAQRTNQHSLQKLNSLIRSLKGGESLPKSTIPFEFYCHPSTQNQSQQAKETPLVLLKATFEPPNLRSPQYRSSAKAILRAYAAHLNYMLESLFVQTGIIDAKDMSPPPKALSRHRNSSKATPWIQDVSWGTSSIDRIQRELIDLHIGSGDFKRPTSKEEDLALIASDNVYFHPTLSRAQKLRGLRLFTSHMIDLSYHTWMHVPILITSTYTRKPPGFVSIPYNFSKAELVGHLNSHLEDIKGEVDGVRKSSEAFLQIQSKIKETLNLCDISVWGPCATDEKAMDTLRQVLEQCPTLKQHDWTGTNLIIHDRFQLEPKGNRMFIPKGADATDVVRFVQDSIEQSQWPWPMHDGADAWLKLKANHEPHTPHQG